MLKPRVKILREQKSTYVCENCGKSVEVWHFPRGWIGAFATAYCCGKCYSEHLDKVIKGANP